MRLRISSEPGPRRRLATLVSASLVALVAGVVLGGRAGEDGASETAGAPEPQEDPLSELTLRQRVGQLVMLRFDGTELPSYAVRAFEAGEAAGAILFTDNVASERQLRSLTASLQEAAAGGALVAADQEGGEIRIVPFAAPQVSAGELARPDAAERYARRGARDLTDLGINVNLAPVADVASVPGSVMAGRAYPGDAPQVAELVSAAIRGHEDAGAASTAKHFPGLGAAVANTDDAAVTIERPSRELRDVDLEPFRAAVDADVPLVMAGHALYPALDPRRIASQSPAVLQGLLRGELGYEGVIVTDSMEAEAVLSRSSTPSAAVASVEAGADLLLTTSSASYGPVFERLLAFARRSEAFRERVDESAARLLALKKRLGLRSPGP